MQRDGDSEQKEAVRSAFTRQAESYAASERVADPEGRRAFVGFVDPAPEASVLDIATGPGFVALAFAERVRAVVGIDITPAMLGRAELEGVRRDLANVRFELGDVESLPFADGSFDVVTCGSAFHHFPQPERVLREMIRVLRPGGRVAISDITTSEDAEQAARHNRIENLRDPSHTRSLPVSELVALGERNGLRTLRTQTVRRERGLEEWVAISKTPPETVEAVRRLLIAAIEGDSAGIGVWLDGSEPHFWHTSV
ncbi:MAG TPA: methyltransferase domain-containing protein, partial [Steroidobacteraceae bacterium]|nr:methyltransferase domain-containing protein [Steroidobacteraceae bacterium]